MNNKTIINGKEFACPKCGGHILLEAFICTTCFIPIWKCEVYGEAGNAEISVGERGTPGAVGGDELWHECDECGEKVDADTLVGLFGSADEDEEN